MLVRNGLLIVGRSYRANAGERSRCKSYSFPDAVRAARKVTVVLRWRPNRQRAKKQATQLSAQQAYVAAAVARLTLAPGWESDPEITPKHRPAIERFVTGEWYAKTDRNGRLHHNFCSLPRAARKWVRFEREPLAGADYSALHPHLVLSMVTDPTERAKLAEWLADDIYARLAASTDPKARKKAKTQFNAGVNDRIEHEYRYPAFVTFAREFPVATAVIRDWKRKSHAEAANVLQRLESRLVFAEVVASCMAHGVPVISLHDALFVASGHVEFLRAEMVAAAHRLLRVPINVKAA